MMLRLVLLALSAAGASAAVCVLILVSQRWHGKHTLDHDLDSVQKFHTTAVPRIGGAAIVAAIFITLMLFGLIAPTTLPQLSIPVLLLLVAQPAFIAGIVEDLTKKVSVRIRLLASIISALLASWILGATIAALDIWGIDSLLTWAPAALAITAFVVAGGVNAINIIDGFNGLASSTVVVMLVALGLVGLHVGDPLVAELAILGLGATFGFLLVNFPTGRLFLGDGGAYFLGFWVSEVAVLLLVRNPVVSAWQVLGICAYPVIEVLFSMYRRKILRQSSPGSPDGLHLHTLVYRRVVSRIFSLNADLPWQRNAAVTCVMVPWVAIAAFASVTVGDSMLNSIGIVLAQIVIYLLVYARIVRGRWWRPTAAIAPALDDCDRNLKGGAGEPFVDAR